MDIGFAFRHFCTRYIVLTEGVCMPVLNEFVSRIVLMAIIVVVAACGFFIGKALRSAKNKKNSSVSESAAAEKKL